MYFQASTCIVDFARHSTDHFSSDEPEVRVSQFPAKVGSCLEVASASARLREAAAQTQLGCSQPINSDNPGNSHSSTWRRIYSYSPE